MDLNLEAVTAKVKSVPPLVWVAVAAVVILYLVVVRGGSSSGSTGGVVGGAGGGGGGGDTPPDIGQQIVDLAAELRLNTAADKAFQDGVLDAINNLPGTGAPGVPTPVPPMGPIPTAPTAPTAPALPAIKKLWGADVSSSITRMDPTGVRTAAAILKSGAKPSTKYPQAGGYGTVINNGDLFAAFKRAGIKPRSTKTVDYRDVADLIHKYKV